MRYLLALLFTATASCTKERPEAPTSEQSDQLNESENLLDALANEQSSQPL